MWCLIVFIMTASVSVGCDNQPIRTAELITLMLISLTEIRVDRLVAGSPTNQLATVHGRDKCSC